MIQRILVGSACLFVLTSSTVKGQSDKPLASAAVEIVTVSKGNGVITNVWSDGSITAQVETDDGYVELPIDRAIKVLNKKGVVISLSQIRSGARVEVVRAENGKGFEIIVDQD